METQERKKSRKDIDTFVLIFGIGALIFFFTSTYFDVFWQYLMASCTIISFFVGSAGKSRKIGFGAAFFISFFLSPVLGLIITFNSPKVREEEYKEKMLEISENKIEPTISLADELYKLNELRKEGVLTDEEFNEQKSILLSR